MVFGILTGAALVASTGCSTKAAPPPRTASAGDPGSVVATVGGASVTLSQVDEKALQQPTSNYGNVKLAQALYEARRAALDEVVDDLLITEDAKARNIPRATLLTQEVTSKVAQPTDADVQAWYQANQARLNGASLEQVNAPIRAFLLQQTTTDIRRTYLDRLRTTAAIRVLLDPPRQDVATANRHGADRVHRVLRFRVPVLLARPFDGRAGHGRLR